MKKKFLLFIIGLTFVISSITLFLVIAYVNPFQFYYIAVFSFLFSFILSVSTFFTVFLYFFKKIYYRDNVYVYHVLSSFRQGFLLSIFFACLAYFYKIGAPVFITGFVLAIILLLFEFFIKSYEE